MQFCLLGGEDFRPWIYNSLEEKITSERMMKKIQIINSTQLKLILVVFMVLNHVHLFFEFTDSIPIWFKYVGGFVPPCFLLLMVDGFELTHDRKKYYMRLWFISAIMGIVKWTIRFHGFALRCDDIFPYNGIIANFLVLFVIFAGIEAVEKRKYRQGILLIAFPFIWGLAGFFIGIKFPDIQEPLYMIHAAVFPNMFLIEEGNFHFIIVGIAAYLTRKNRLLQVVTCIVVTFLSFTLVKYWVSLTLFGIRNELWYDITMNTITSFGFIPMLFYNGKRGKGSGKFFYYFYPLHIYFLYAVSGIVYDLMYPGSGQIKQVTIPMIGATFTIAGVFAVKEYLSVPGTIGGDIRAA